ncbi:hypothetical protein, partial [uncultured Microscilla sp.]|uniref:hypothetical protein n=1 Tax=uncultured Microscilla sp. TaxID=432653 RepID=UPI00261F002C
EKRDSARVSFFTLVPFPNHYISIILGGYTSKQTQGITLQSPSLFYLKLVVHFTGNSTKKYRLRGWSFDPHLLT